MPAAVGLKAYERVRTLGLLNINPSKAALEAVLSEPLEIDGRKWTNRPGMAMMVRKNAVSR